MRSPPAGSPTTNVGQKWQGRFVSFVVFIIISKNTYSYPLKWHITEIIIIIVIIIIFMYFQ